MNNPADNLEKVYNPDLVEQKWYGFWEENGLFKADSESSKPVYTIVIPPPNVTGVLHIGHALNQTLQDILVRYKRMSGFNTLWLPGMDHAGIATQNVVNRQLTAKNIEMEQLGRERFLEKVWDWKKESGGTILKQLRRLGSSVDWSRERFTMDKGLSKAVQEVFVTLYREGLIYQGNYMVNWCPQCRTALSDLEVEHEEVNGKLYHIKYIIPGSASDDTEDLGLTVATTRPETIPGDTAIAVNPADERYRELLGKTVLVPVINKEIPIIADSYVSMEFGTGALKITPAHDPNDFEVGKRHNLDSINLMDEKGCMNSNAAGYAGLDRYECRKQIVNDMQASGYLIKVEDHLHAVGHCYRCKTAIEPRISTQWFVKTKELARPAIEAARSGRLKFHPANWANTYYNWLENIRDWCISRQIWWGHQIPAWHCNSCGHINVDTATPDSCSSCGAGDLRQETDVLDTWFSSALWPFSTLGWPERTADLKTFYPTNTLITGFDILFFWVARMVMMGLKFTGETPFEDVYIHALVRDGQGNKMSKSRGNVIDPISIIEKSGADALRFTFAAMASPGRDIKLSEDRISGYRNFMNKIWNSARFILMNLDVDNNNDINANYKNTDLLAKITDTAGMQLHDRWILSELQKSIKETRKQLDTFRFDEAANSVYSFFWHKFCDWYLELGKGEFTSRPRGAESVRILVYTFEKLLKLMHPFIPFITEEIWQTIPHMGKSIVVADYPEPDEKLSDSKAVYEMDVVIEVISAVRAIRSELKIPNKQLVTLQIQAGEDASSLLLEQSCYIRRLGKVDKVQPVLKPDSNSSSSIIRDFSIHIPLKGLINLEEEAEKTRAEIKKLQTECQKNTNKLRNRDFMAKAPDAVVKKTEAIEKELKTKIIKLTENLKKFKG